IDRQDYDILTIDSLPENGLNVQPDWERISFTDALYPHIGEVAIQGNDLIMHFNDGRPPLVFEDQIGSATNRRLFFTDGPGPDSIATGYHDLPKSAEELSAFISSLRNAQAVAAASASLPLAEEMPVTIA